MTDRNPRRAAPPPWTTPHPLLSDLLRTDTAKALQADDVTQGLAEYEEIDADGRTYIDRRLSLLNAVLLDEIRRLLMRVLKATATSAKGARLTVDGLRSVHRAVLAKQDRFGDDDELENGDAPEGDDDMDGEDKGYTTSVTHRGPGATSTPVPAPAAPTPAIQMEPVGGDGAAETPPPKRTRRAQPEA